MKTRHDALPNETPEQLIEQIARLMDEAEAMLVGPVAIQAGEVKSRFSELENRFAEFYGQSRRSVVARAKAADETIRAHPYESLAVALGLGVLLGALLKR